MYTLANESIVMKRRQHIISIVALLFVDFVCRRCAAKPPAPDVSAGRLRLTVASGARMRLWVDGVPLITDSHLYLVKPGWSGVLLNTDTMAPVLSTSFKDGAQVVTADFDNAVASAHYRFELDADNTLIERVTFSTKRDPLASSPDTRKAEVEFATGYVNANVISGQPFSADTSSSMPSRGIVPADARSADEEASRVVPSLFWKIQIESRLGPVTISVAGTNAVTSSLNLFDARKQQETWATAHPIFWLGIGAPSLPIPSGENTVTVTYAFGPAPMRTAADPLAIPSSAIEAVAMARARPAPELPVIPRPKSMKSVGSPLRLSPMTRIITTEPSLPEESSAAREIAADLKTFWGLSVAVVPGGTWKEGDIRLSRSGRLDTGVNRSVLTVPDKPEGYGITVDARGAALCGYDARGVYNAAQTFKQLIRADDRGVYVKPVDIADWPTLGFRGVEWYGGPDSLPFHQRMIDRIIAPLKYNAMVLQAEYTAWDSQPKLRGNRTTPKSETRKTIAEARACFLEPIPLVPSLGHMEWFFQNGQNHDLAADPSKLYTIDPDNPRAYDALFPLYDEIIDLFHPRRFHIGHDEIAMTGVFPRKGSKKSTTELYIESVNRLHDWLAKRSVKTMIWGDELLAPGEGTAANAASRADSKSRRAGIPKDIVVGDWHYSGSTFPSIGLLEKSGFETLASTWYDLKSMRLFAAEAAKQGAGGLLQTTWAGYTMTLDQVKGEDFKQFVAYLIAAEQAWNGGANDIDSLGYDPSEAFLALYDRVPFDPTKHTGFTVNLAGAANTPRKAIQLSGALNPAGAWPDALTVTFGRRKVSTLAWTWATTFVPAWGAKIATVSVLYVDGREETFPITYGREIVAFSDPRIATAARRGINSGTGNNGAARRFEWTNPRPDISIDQITLTSDRTEAAPVLVRLSGVE